MVVVVFMTMDIKQNVCFNKGNCVVVLSYTVSSIADVSVLLIPQTATCVTRTPVATTPSAWTG